MGTFSLKKGDLEPALEVVLVNPDDTVHDLSLGSPTVYLHIKLASEILIQREMDITVNPSAGIVRYLWQVNDWNELVVGQHTMEYEVVRSASRITFPNNDYDVLSIRSDIADGP